MKTHHDTLGHSNPFSTRFIRPGAIPFQFLAGQSATALLETLAANGGRGQIIGPHGSGKSTLVALLLATLAERGQTSWLISLRDGQRRLPGGWVAEARGAEARLIVVDGYEQLGIPGRLELRFHCWWHGWELLVTAHADVGFPTLYRTTTDLALAQSIVTRLIPPDGQTPEAAFLDEQAIADSFAASGGNLRDMLFKLYDRYEQNARTPQAGTNATLPAPFAIDTAARRKDVGNA